MRIFPYSRQKISSSDIKAVSRVLRSDFITQGPEVKKFEDKICKAIKSKYSVAVNSATSALHIACMALNFKKKDILWTVPNTFVASANCAIHLGGKVDFVDIDYQSGNIDVSLLEQKLIKAKKNKKLPKILIPVHFAGLPTEQDRIWKLAKRFNFKIIEDASHSLGSRYKGNITGNCKWSDITVFSLHPVKIITTGEGGIAATNSEKLYKKLQIFKNHGITKEKSQFIYKKNKYNDWYYEQQYLGLNFRMNEISAALGISQLKKLKYFVKERNKIAKYYKKNLKLGNLLLPNFSKEFYSSFHLFVIKIKHKKYKVLQRKLFNLLRKNNYFVQVHYIPVHLQPFYRKRFKFENKELTNSVKHSESSISLPIYPGLKKRFLLNIVKIIKNFVAEECK
jgi:UDP-4-amino-4,6-dideoxy-N-acetyl-beta-L-altrosamine transaminase